MKSKVEIKNYGIVFTYDMLNKFLAGFCSILVIRLLSTAEYANYTVFNSMAVMMSSMIGSSISTSYLRIAAKKISKNELDDGKYYTLCLLMLFLIFMVCLICHKLFSYLYKVPFIIVFLSSIDAMVISINQLNVYVFQVRENYSLGGKVNNLRNMCLLIFLLLLYFYLKKVTDIVVIVLTVFVGIISIISSFFLFSKLRDFHLMKPSISTIDMKWLLFEIKWLTIYFFLLAMINATDVIMLKFFMNSNHVANYGVAYKYYSLVLSVLPSITAILRVKSSKKEFESSAEKRLLFVQNWIKKSTIVVIPVVLIIIIITKVLWKLLNGPCYELGYTCFIIFLLGAAMSYIFSPCVNFILSANKHSNLCYLALMAFIFNIITNFSLVREYGAVAVTFTTVISQAIINVGSTLLLIRNDKRSLRAIYEK